MLWVLKSTQNIYAKTDGQENINIFTLKIFVSLGLWGWMDYMQLIILKTRTTFNLGGWK